jgi:hypothetical protein
MRKLRTAQMTGGACRCPRVYLWLHPSEPSVTYRELEVLCLHVACYLRPQRGIPRENELVFLIFMNTLEWGSLLDFDWNQICQRIRCAVAADSPTTVGMMESMNELKAS